uniref:J domain-containing protein n=1 Tax=Micromonas pusilla TaxID=38833 RepID=A0A7R9TDC0_MICPS
MGGGAGDAAPDPYKALGVKPGADADEIKKALDRKKLLYKSEPEKLAKMEEAYESIVQASLAARLKGDLSGVDKKILNADAVSLFGPWAPIKCESVMKDKQVNVAIAAAATIITYMTPATVRNLQPIIYATIFMMFRMFAKLADVDPGPSANIDREAAQQHNNKRFFRSFSIVLATFAATLFATYYLPNIIFEMFSISVPVWYLLNQEVIVTAFCSVALAVLTCFYR